MTQAQGGDTIYQHISPVVGYLDQQVEREYFSIETLQSLSIFWPKVVSTVFSHITERFFRFDSRNMVYFKNLRVVLVRLPNTETVTINPIHHWGGAIWPPSGQIARELKIGPGQTSGTFNTI